MLCFKGDHEGSKMTIQNGSNCRVRVTVQHPKYMDVCAYNSLMKRQFKNKARQKCTKDLRS